MGRDYARGRVSVLSVGKLRARTQDGRTKTWSLDERDVFEKAERWLNERGCSAETATPATGAAAGTPAPPTAHHEDGAPPPAAAASKAEPPAAPAAPAAAAVAGTPAPPTAHHEDAAPPAAVAASTAEPPAAAADAEVAPDAELAAAAAIVAESIAARASEIERLGVYWGFFDWLAWGWAERCQVCLLVASERTGGKAFGAHTHIFFNLHVSEASS